jgi:AcrR family transcriptional regulator
MGRPKNFTRDAVLEKALLVFWRRGFADASLHELELATGVNKSGLYAEFKDKEDLFMQSLHAGFPRPKLPLSLQAIRAPHC